MVALADSHGLSLMPHLAASFVIFLSLETSKISNAVSHPE